MKTSSRAGFTLIELLVVIAILGLLIAYFTTDLISAQATANEATERRNLQWHWQQIKTLMDRHDRPPRGTGPQWVLDPWVQGIPERTPQNLDRYFTPGSLESQRQTYLKTLDVEQVWTSLDEITSEDTDYAGRSADHRIRRLESGKIPWVATDNEGVQPTFASGTVFVLMGDSSVRDLTIVDDFAEYGWTPGDTRPFPVGPDSPHPLLQQLDPLVR